MNKLIDFWKNLNIKKNTFVHPDDSSIGLDNNYTCSYENFIKNNYLDFIFDEKKTHKFHFGIIPVPYVGDIEKAKIYILMLNPGFEILDYYAETKDAELRKALFKNLKQEFSDDEEYPFLFLNPKFLWHSGGQYWLKRLKNLIIEVKKKQNTYEETLKYIAQKIAVLQLVPYYSKSYSGTGFKELQSPKVVKEFVKEKAEKGKYIVVVRGNDKWKLKECDNVLIRNKSRNAYFCSDEETIKWMLEKM